jgi:hypothetical protein
MSQEIKAQGALYVGKPGKAAKITSIKLYTGTIDPASLADGVGETKTMTATGAALGDFVVMAAPYDMQDLIATPYVASTNNLAVRIQNENAAGAINLASGTWRALVIKADTVS